MIEPDGAELRVLGALIEKQRTTPDTYPLSLNALRLACNQSTGRDPVVDYDEDTIRDAIARLVRRGWARLASGPGSRATKYRHLLDEALSLDGAQLSVLAVLMLRGPQTPGELRARTDRLHQFATLDELDTLLEALAGRRLILRFDRRPGQKEARWHLTEQFGGSSGGEAQSGVFASEPGEVQLAADAAPPATDAAPLAAGELEARVTALERDLGALRDLVAQLRAQRG